jgi:hypothetical protein
VHIGTGSFIGQHESVSATHSYHVIYSRGYQVI